MSLLEVVTPVPATGFFTLSWLLIAVPALSAAVLLLVVAVGGLAVLGTWDMPAPSKTVEKVLADERFPVDAHPHLQRHHRVQVLF